MVRNLPHHPERKYAPANVCIYCGAIETLSDEHIVPFGLGGRWVFPRSSCTECAKKTATFEGTCLRTMLGPLRMIFDLPSRRRNKRPQTLPLKVKRTRDAEWSVVEVDQKICPFLILLPVLRMPDELSGYTTVCERGAVASQFWIRAASNRDGVIPHLEAVAHELGVYAVEPTADFRVPEFFMMLAKIAHAFAVAEIGVGKFEPFLTQMIRNSDTSISAQYIGGLKYTEPASMDLHEISFDSHTCDRPDIVSVRIRLLAALETPTYYIAVGRR